MSVEVGVLALYVVPLALTIHLVGRVSTDTSKPAGGDEALFGAPLLATMGGYRPEAYSEALAKRRVMNLIQKDTAQHGAPYALATLPCSTLMYTASVPLNGTADARRETPGHG
eukprot:COSAG02_NODE_2039_length_10034_cov_3.282536_5_plen_113_part_00